MSRLDGRNARWLNYLPKNVATRLRVNGLVRNLLQAVVDASSPVAFYTAWRKFYELPSNIFALNSRGGQKKGKHYVTNQIDKLVVKYLKPANEGGVNHDVDDVDEEEDHYVDENGIERGPIDRTARRIAAADRMLTMGYLSRAWNILINKPIEPATEETFDEIGNMFPEFDLSTLPAEKHGSALEADAISVREVISSLSRGGGYGPSRWSPDIFRAFLDDDDVCALYAEALTMVVNNHNWMSAELAQLFLGARLVAPEKAPATAEKPATHRAIGVSEAPWQHLQLIAYLQIDKEWIKEMSSSFNRLAQYGIGIPNGVAKAYRLMESLLLLACDHNISDTAALLEDMKDAYQTLDRGKALRTLYRHQEAKPLWDVVNLALRHAAPRYIKMADGSTRVIQQTAGVTQGWIIASLVYCLSTLDDVKVMLGGRVRPDYPLTAACVVDDMNFFGANELLSLAVDHAVQKMPRTCGQQLNLNKTVVVQPFAGALSDELVQEWNDKGVEVVHSAKLLGSCLSTDEDQVIQFARERVGLGSERAQRAWALLKHPAMTTQSFVLYVTRAVQHWLDYTARLVGPKDAEAMFQEWDDALYDLFCFKMGRTELQRGAHLPMWTERFEREKRQVQLPTHYSGIGLRPLTTVSLVAYVADLAACAEEILGAMEIMGSDTCPARYVTQYDFCRDALIELVPEYKHASFDKPTDRVEGNKLKLLPTSLKCFLRQFQQRPHLVDKFQKRLSLPIWEAQYKRLKMDVEREDGAAAARRLSSYASGGVAGRIWTMVPSHPSLRVSNAHLGMTLRSQVGALLAPWMYMVQGKLMCRGCNKVDFLEVPSHGYHCPPLRRLQQNDRHDDVCNDFVAFAKRNRIPVIWTPYLPTGQETDLGFVFPQHTIQTDVTIVSPEAPSKSGKGNGGPAEQAIKQANAKIKRYQELVATVGDIFVPLAFETSGAYTRHVHNLLCRIRDAGTQENAVSNPILMQEMRDRLATTLVRDNATLSVVAVTRQRADAPAYAEHIAERRRRMQRLRHRQAGRRI
jgi:hypothetical protein